MSNTNANRLRHFIFSQSLADGVRITLTIILPVIICAQLGEMSTGLTVALGSLCASIADIPGSVQSKRNGMLYCTGFVFLMSLFTGFLNHNIFTLGLLVCAAAFFFTMIGIYGNRAASIGTASLLVIILRMADVGSPVITVTNSLLILAGSGWYLIIALLFHRLTPYRAAQRALGDCIHETAKILRIKSALYDININFEDEYRKLVIQQIVVNEKQDAARELLFKNKEILKEPSRTGRLLVLTFADAVDLYEQIMATWYDYKLLRERFGPSGILDDVSAIIRKLAGELDNIGLAIQSNSTHRKGFELAPELDILKKKTDALEEKYKSNLVLKKILVNLRNLGAHIDELNNYFNFTVSPAGKMRSKNDYSKFVSQQEIDPVVLRNNLTLDSGVFRHALRMTIACLAGFIVVKLISYGHHSYWILLSIIILLKPGFSLTKERNIQRFAGTIAGGILGLLVLYLIHDRDILFAIIIFFMIGTYTFMRLNYIVMVIFTTPYVLILFNLLGHGFVKVAEERLLDTGIACLLSFLASYLLFPHWESGQLNVHLKNVLKANIGYLQKIRTFFSGRQITSLEYKLARKEVYVSTANLSAAFNRMLSEPKKKQRNGKLIYEFVVLNHVLSSNIASLSSEIRSAEQKSYSKYVVQQVKRSVSSLETGLLILDKNYIPDDKENNLLQVASKDMQPEKDLTDQLDFIYKLALEIQKLIKLITV